MTPLAIHRQSGQGKERDIAPNSNTQTLDPQDPPAPPSPDSLCSIIASGGKPTGPKSL